LPLIAKPTITVLSKQFRKISKMANTIFCIPSEKKVFSLKEYLYDQES